jgi:hypothetical protein
MPLMNNTLLEQYGYTNGAPVRLIEVKGSTVTVGEPQDVQITPTPGLTWGIDECLIHGSRVQRERLYIPGTTRFECTQILGLTPKLHVYTTEKLKTQALADIKQNMRAVLSRLAGDASELVSKYTALCEDFD